MADINGRLKLTWGQVAWCLSVLAVLIGGWYRIEFRLGQLEIAVKDGIYSKAAIEEMRRDVDRIRIHDELRQEFKRALRGETP